MKSPKIGKKTFLRDIPKSGDTFDTFIKEVYEKDAIDNPLYTGRHFLILNEGNRSIVKATKLLEGKLGFTVANTADFVKESLNESKIKDADALFYNELGIALIDIDEDQRVFLEGSRQDYLIEPEKVVYIPDDIPAETEKHSAWGIEVTEALYSQYTGAGIKLAVIDTGFDTGHPDFAGREIITSTFVPDENVNDIHGHGTHCTGIACGSVDMNGVRYGVAPGADIYAGKVLSNEGSGAQAWVLDGMTWAANSGCRVLSMSFGSRVFAGQSYDIAYERAAQFARSKGTVIVAAAGNESKRTKEKFYPVNSPADCPSILAVAALDQALKVADFSNRAINPNGLVDVAAPGVSVYSSWIMPVRNRFVSGTSMATPHVAGIVALLFEKYPDATPAMAEKELRDLARSLPLSPEDVGVGLSIAP
ncbi:MAG: S8 family serine peptidase [Proteiniphilum sp.]|jgi:subtilisin family serine protease|nr:S8 family serine peptidase [Proteiniphilum sp.]